MDTTAGLTMTANTDGTLVLAIIHGPHGAYLDALAEARAYWCRMNADGPAPTDAEKLAVLAGLNTRVAAAQEAAEAAGIPFDMSDVMCL
ncbi:hypothetical protein HNR23_002266 [Nocardiopsis mwathae]|uniref:Uncharacterized protein n=1 Tax=Nocardiopsis mwathae TaxID=1472723 RepID=A0A7X0D603_9ACTN|nr:hypothetical protein [Nocardiopsis mwathae]MBB6172206.1 hypothetical protein [Nocardiopsis mwathae]